MSSPLVIAVANDVAPWPAFEEGSRRREAVLERLVRVRGEGRLEKRVCELDGVKRGCVLCGLLEDDTDRGEA